MVRRIINLFVAVFAALHLSAQGDLDSLLKASLGNPTEEVLATFKTTRIINGHSTERVRKGDLDFRVVHRFGSVKGGAYEFFGIDQSTSQFGLEYGLNDYIMLGISRATWQKTTSGLMKISLLRQKTGEKPFPFSLSYITSVFVNGLKWADETRTNYFSSRLNYLHQMAIARKLSPSFSVQISPLLIHRNLAPGEQTNDIFALGAGGRYKLTVRTAIVAEYYYVINSANLATASSNCLSLGFDIETGSHVFQIMLTNSQGICENSFIPYSSGKWTKGDLFLGFNICRFFTTGASAKNKK
jgi:hypothetical protein